MPADTPRVTRSDLEVAFGQLRGAPPFVAEDAAGISLEISTAAIDECVHYALPQALSRLTNPSTLAFVVGDGPPDRDASLYASGVGIGILLGAHMVQAAERRAR